MHITKITDRYTDITDVHYLWTLLISDCAHIT